jgi:hypothetical protein
MHTYRVDDLLGTTNPAMSSRPIQIPHHHPTAETTPKTHYTLDFYPSASAHSHPQFPSNKTARPAHSAAHTPCIIRDKPAIPTDTVRRSNPLVHMLRRARPRQVAILKRAFLARLPGKRVPDALRAGETAAVGRDAEYDLVRGDALACHVRHGRVAGDRGFRAVGDLWGEELGLMAAFAGPGARVVIRH